MAEVFADEWHVVNTKVVQSVEMGLSSQGDIVDRKNWSQTLGNNTHEVMHST